LKQLQSFQAAAKQIKTLASDPKVKEDLEDMKKKADGSGWRTLAFISMIIVDLTVVGLILMNLLNSTGTTSIPKVQSNWITALFDITVSFATSSTYKSAIEATQLQAAKDLDDKFQTALMTGKTLAADKNITVPSATASSSKPASGSAAASSDTPPASATTPASGGSGHHAAAN